MLRHRLNRVVAVEWLMIEGSDQLREPDLRVLKSMLYELEQYQRCRIGLPQLVNNLDVGIEALSEDHSALSRVLRDAWRVLEELNAFALEEDRLRALEEDEGTARRATQRLSDLIASVANDG